MNEYEKDKYETIKGLVEGVISRKEAAFKLDLTLRQIDRLKNSYKNNNQQSFIHGNRGKESEKRINSSIIEELKQLYLQEYYDYNITAFYEEITENEKYKGKYDISYSTLYEYFLNDDIISPIAHKGTIKLYNEKMSNAIENNQQLQEEKIELFQSRQITFAKAHIRRSVDIYAFGQEVQMDACVEKWFGNVTTHLHLAVDKATKKVLSGWFEYEEITRGYFVLLYMMIINYGIPKKIKTDNRNSFSNQESEVDSTQFGIICKKLNIELVTTSIPTKKANVERENGTFKNRLIAELRHEEITDIDEANRYINEVFIPKMNNKFSYEIDYKTSMMRPNNYSEQELDLIISEKEQRIIDNACSIKYNNNYYIPTDPNTGEVVCFTNKTECSVILTYHAELWCEIENKYYKLSKLNDRSTYMKKETDNSDTNVSKKKNQYKPPKDSPWRKFKIN